MIFRQLFHPPSCTYTYLLASRSGGEAILIDPVKDDAHKYVKLLEELDTKLVFAFDTHVHADHVTALGSLREISDCTTVMGEQSKATCVSRKVTDGESIVVDGVRIDAMYTPGHTDDSYTFRVDNCLFTGDTLLIRGTGRTDFQNGDARMQYDSIFTKLLTHPPDTFVYPAHDYNGQTVSTIAEEIAYNPRLQVTCADDYVKIMDSLDLSTPKLMDIAVPANLECGLEVAAQ